MNCVGCGLDWMLERDFLDFLDFVLGIGHLFLEFQHSLGHYTQFDDLNEFPIFYTSNTSRSHPHCSGGEVSHRKYEEKFKLVIEMNDRSGIDHQDIPYWVARVMSQNQFLLH